MRRPPFFPCRPGARLFPGSRVGCLSSPAPPGPVGSSREPHRAASLGATAALGTRTTKVSPQQCCKWRVPHRAVFLSNVGIGFSVKIYCTVPRDSPFQSAVCLTWRVRHKGFLYYKSQSPFSSSKAREETCKLTKLEHSLSHKISQTCMSPWTNSLGTSCTSRCLSVWSSWFW